MLHPPSATRHEVAAKREAISAPGIEKAPCDAAARLAHLQDILAISQEITGLGCTILNLTDGKVSWSAQQYRNLGLQDGAVEPSIAALVERIHPDERELLLDAFERCVLSGTSFALELRTPWQDGSSHVLRVCGHRVAGDSYERTWFACATVDITEQRRLHDQLLQARCDLEHAQEIAHLGTWVADVHTGIVETSSPEAYRIFSMHQDSLPIRLDDLNRRIHPDDLARVVAARDRAFSVPGERYNCQYRVVHGEDDVRHVHSLADVTTDAAGRPQRMVGVIQDITEIRRAQQEIQRLAFFDDTTGLPNRVAMRKRLATLLGDGGPAMPLALLIVELPYFRQINLTLGHVNADTLLRDVARRIAGLLDTDAHLSRTGNAQFSVILQGRQAQDAARIASIIAGAFETTFAIAGVQYDIGATVGTAVAPLHARELTELLRKADVAVYQARQNGLNCMVYSPAEDPYDPARLALLGQFRNAISDGQIELYCQPKVSMTTGAVLGAEALVRWRHPERGMVPPSEFVPLIESSELIHALTRHMLQESVRQAQAWRREGLSLPIAVNLSTRNLTGGGLADDLQALLADCGGTPDWIGLEITESSLIVNPGASIAELNTLSRLGFQLYIDDFGTGYSSLNYLTMLPVNVIKIDHGFTSNMLSDKRAAAIVKATIDLAHDLGMAVVAEGTASREIWDALLAFGCDEAQGYYVAPPLPAREFAQWVRMHEMQLPTADTRPRLLT
ncbi:EAL domain-containing protein [Massilia sp. IC2-477]|uniref:putative bifunctional diguanylate cyclase/phosphodiesterase n=1 Tax=Massilia sp. IC2-477 TaxID=2887198 RepID=UPI001D0F7381|nr:GGDEF and EAL domain-containing protein [Massilia sp. IC2-477]MCC2957542.1 EAL domain-containing protein [Massilia sp. IC2-477]